MLTITDSEPPCFAMQTPAPVDFDAIFSKEAQEREMPKLRQLATAFNGIPGLIPLHGGLPPASAFPLTGLQLTMKDGTTIDIRDPQEVHLSVTHRHFTFVL